MIVMPVAECGRAFEQARARLGEQRDGGEGKYCGEGNNGGRRQNFTNGVGHGVVLARFEG
jgi:hypothetical protein